MLADSTASFVDVSSSNAQPRAFTQVDQWIPCNVHIFQECAKRECAGAHYANAHVIATMHAHIMTIPHGGQKVLRSRHLELRNYRTKDQQIDKGNSTTTVCRSQAMISPLSYNEGAKMGAMGEN
ncbi:hypothetical protein FVE85_9699 [Porphyridium purpureum]|uniref:Uncharacterized protein n=1 Tax=Porphyridium purpureum TaxID=35688 RepID=A0A5J4YKZ3_PORPP|nr:hypothetical protein FVE85_9699 [Porphyridium purpureum]|eukprot:POR0895..scf246_12